MRTRKIGLFDVTYTKKTLIVYIVLRVIVIFSMIRQIIHGEWTNAGLCVITLILFTLPSFINKKLNIKMPDVLEMITLFFIFGGEILGEIKNFYGLVPNWDTMLHTVNGFLCAAIGFSLVDILNNTKKFYMRLSPLFVVLVSVCFSMTIGVIWELIEFQADQILKNDMQKDAIVQNIASHKLDASNYGKDTIRLDNITKTKIYHIEGNEIIETTIDGGYLDIGIYDTMKDLFVNFVGAVVFSIIGLLYIKNRDKYKFAENFIPKINET